MSGRRTNRASNKGLYRHRLDVKKGWIGFLIGPGGSVIRNLQKKYRIRSRIDQERGVYHLSGMERDVSKALGEITAHINWIKSVTEKKKVAREEVDEEGWTHKKEVSQKPKRQVVKSTVEVTRKNAFDALDVSSDDEEEEEDDMVVPIAEVSKPTGVWADGVASAVKEDGVPRLSRGMLMKRLADAREELKSAEKDLAYHKSADDGSWASEADISDASEEVARCNGVVRSLLVQIEEC